MLEFKPIEITDKALIEKYYKRENHFLCEYCFTDLFIWFIYISKNVPYGTFYFANV